MPNRLSAQYFQQNDAVFIAQDLIGKKLVRQFDAGNQQSFLITETEAYLGMEDLACHASKGKTNRTQIMFEAGGVVYVYLIYGMYWMLNIVTGPKDHPQAVLIRGISNFNGPGKLGKYLQLDKSFYGENLENSSRIWLEHENFSGEIISTPRIGIDYAGEIWKNKPWRFLMKNS